MKKRSKKPEGKIRKQKAEEEKDKHADKVTPDEDTSEYGGIPARDLKKNLGCG